MTCKDCNKVIETDKDFTRFELQVFWNYIEEKHGILCVKCYNIFERKLDEVAYDKWKKADEEDEIKHLKRREEERVKDEEIKDKIKIIREEIENTKKNNGNIIGLQDKIYKVFKVYNVLANDMLKYYDNKSDWDYNLIYFETHGCMKCKSWDTLSEFKLCGICQRREDNKNEIRELIKKRKIGIITEDVKKMKIN